MQLKPYANETYLDFADPAIDAAQKAAIEQVRQQLGKTYKNYINGQ